MGFIEERKALAMNQNTHGDQDKAQPRIRNVPQTPGALLCPVGQGVHKMYTELPGYSWVFSLAHKIEGTRAAQHTGVIASHAKR